MTDNKRWKVIKWKCNKCNQYKGVFKTDIFSRKTCIECGEILVVEALSI